MTTPRFLCFSSSLCSAKQKFFTFHLSHLTLPISKRTHNFSSQSLKSYKSRFRQFRPSATYTRYDIPSSGIPYSPYYP